MVDTKPTNKNAKGNQVIKNKSSGHVNKAFRLSDKNIYTISRQISDNPDGNGVDSSKTLLNSQPTGNFNLPSTTFIERKNSKLASKIADSNKKWINRPKLMIPLVIMGIFFSIAVISGIVYVVVSTNSTNNNNYPKSNFTIIPISSQQIKTTQISFSSTSIILSSTGVPKSSSIKKLKGNNSRKLI